MPAPASRRNGATAPADTSDPTRLKLLDAAGHVFAENGFQAATIREICSRADANVAAVNYHFRDKLGIYIEVLRSSVGAIPGEALEEAIRRYKDPEQALRFFIAGLLERMADQQSPTWKLRIMAHEMAHPSPALHEVVDQVIRPNYDRLRNILSALLGAKADHEVTRLCAHSIMGQVIHYIHAQPVIAVLWPALTLAAQKDMVSQHIADFSLCAIREQAKKLKNKK